MSFSTVKSFVELAKYLLEQDGVQYILSERFNRDPIEEFFGQQRGHGGSCDNPSVDQFLKNTVSLRVQGSVTSAPERGNCRKRNTDTDVNSNSLPLPKCRCCTKK